MATMLDIVTGALRLTGIIGSGEIPSAADAAEGNTMLNDMLHSWGLQGADLAHVTLAQAATLPYEELFHEAIKYNAAVKFATEWGAPIPPYVGAEAKRLLDVIKAATLEFDDELQVDNALNPRFMHRYQRSGYYDINEG